MMLSRRSLLASAALAAAPLDRARAQPQTQVVRVGVLGDQSGPYRDLSGATSVACAAQALEDFSAANGSFKVELVSADHQNKPDIAASIARQWFDRDGVDMITDLTNSACALAVSAVGKERNRVIITAAAGTTALTGAQCSPNTVQWVYDTYMLAKSTGSKVVEQGGTKWFFVTADYAFGKALQGDTSAVVTKAGGKIAGNALYPFPGTTDFSSFIVQAQSSGANVLGLANAGADTQNCIKQANEFGLKQSGVRVAGLLVQLPDVKAMGLKLAEGIYLTESFYWNLNDRTRAFAKKVYPKTPSNMPAMGPAGCYAGTLHFLKTVAAMGVDKAKEGRAVVARMKAMPCDDDAFGRYTIREDGRTLNNTYLFQVKTPAESHGAWDFYNLVATTPGPEAFRPMSEGHCPLVRA